MEPPTKRQKLSKDYTLSKPTRTIDLASFQRPFYKKRNAGRILLPRVPDVTVTAGVVEVAVNEGSSVTEIAAPTSDATITLANLGTVTVPAVDASSVANDISSIVSSVLPSSLLNDLTSIGTANSTTTDRTVTVTATSTFRVSYLNGTLMLPTKTASHSGSSSEDDSSSSDSQSDSESSTQYTFGQDFTATDSSAATTTAYQGPGAAASVTQSNAAATSSGASGHGGGDSVLTPQQTQMVGGVVGGIAGIALVLIAILFLLRRYKQKLRLQGRLPKALASSPTAKDFGDAGLIGLAAPMSLSSRTSLFTPAASIASNKKMLRPESEMTTLSNGTSHTGPESERGFQRVSGRKIPSVLTTGGDQFGGSYGIFEKEIGSPIAHVRSAGATATSHRHDLSESSIYPMQNDSSTQLNNPFSRSAPTSPQYPAIFTSPPQHPIRPNGIGTPTNYSHPSPHAYSESPTSPTRTFSPTSFDMAFYRNITAPVVSKADGFAISRNSPARTPLIQSPGASNLRLPVHAPVTMDEDIPEMPLPSPNVAMGAGPGIGIGLGYELTMVKQRVPSRLSERNVGLGDNGNRNLSGRFKEELRL